MHITVDDVLALNPCAPYPRQRIEELFAGRDKIKARDILEMTIPDHDKLWVCLHPQVSGQEKVDKLKALFVAMIPEDSPYHLRAIEAECHDSYSWALRFIAATTGKKQADICREFVELVRGLIG